MRTIETEVVVIGGGATGVGVLRDLSLRGIGAILVEKNDLASGTTGRNHGLLHSGARYAVDDLDSARECIQENRVLKRIARHCVEDTGGLFVGLPGDDPDYHARLFAACRLAGIPAREISVQEALALEPNLNPAACTALSVPDGAVDPFRLTLANALDARENGAALKTHTLLTGLIIERGRVAGVRCLEKKTNETLEVHSKAVVLAAGVWVGEVLAAAGIKLAMFPSKGSMVIIDYRVNNVVLNRTRHPADGDIIVPGDTVSLVGTTSRKIPYDRIERLVVEDEEIEVLLKGGQELLPNLGLTRVLRAYAGVRPLIAMDTDVADGRQLTRGIVLIDHGKRDGLEGLVTIAGGKLMTYRLMAEKAVDLVAGYLDVSTPCRTHEKPLPGSEKDEPPMKRIRRFSGVPESVAGSTLARHGARAHQALKRDPESAALICECEMVTRGEVEYALETLGARDLIELRRRTRLGMGPCQGGLCALRAAGLMAAKSSGAAGARAMLEEFIEERYKGAAPVLWGDGLRELELVYWLYEGLLGLSLTHAPEGGQA